MSEHSEWASQVAAAIKVHGQPLNISQKVALAAVLLQQVDAELYDELADAYGRGLNDGWESASDD